MYVSTTTVRRVNRRSYDATSVWRMETSYDLCQLSTVSLTDEVSRRVRLSQAFVKIL